MTASEDGPPFIALEVRNTSMLRMTVVGTGRQDSGQVFPSPFRVWSRVLRVFDSMLVQPLKGWMLLELDVGELHRWNDRDLRDIGINRLDIAAIRAGTYERASSDDADWIVFYPEAGKPEPRTLTEHNPGERTVRWDERPPQIII